MASLGIEILTYAEGWAKTEMFEIARTFQKALQRLQSTTHRRGSQACVVQDTTVEGVSVKD